MFKKVIATAVPLLLGIGASETLLASQDIVQDDLLTSSNVTTPWQVCGVDSLALDVSLLDAGGCAYRTTPAEPGVTYKMTCGITVVKYASITLAFLDADDNTLASDTVEVAEHQSGAWSVTLPSPAGTATAAIGVYGETGSGFQDCVLIDATPDPGPTNGSIAGSTWFDEDGDSVFGGGESTVAGSPVTLFFNGAQLAQTTTTADGSYYFGSLDLDACYTVTFGAADNTVQLGVPGGDNDAGAGGSTGDICLSATNAMVTEVDAAFVAVPPVEPPADYAVCGLTWLDQDGNGVFDGADTVLANVEVELLDDANNPVGNINTGADGSYAFNELVEGNYSVQFVTPDGHEITTAVGTPAAGRSFVLSTGRTTVFNLPAASNTAADSACSITDVNAGYVPLPVALDPTIANDDSFTFQAGTNFTVDVRSNDVPCGNGVMEINLLGHNVVGNVYFNAMTNKFEVTGTTAAGTATIDYGLRGACGSYDTATVTLELTEPATLSPSAPSPSVCRVETGGSTTIGGVDVFSIDENGFASNYNLYDRDKNLVTTVSSTDYTHKYLIGNGANQWEGPFIGNWEIEWNGTNFGYDQVSIFYVAAVENGEESSLQECMRSLISPIALDLENKGRIQRISGDFTVDIDGDGIMDALSQWFAPSAGILVIDAVEGKVSGKQMFGNVPGEFTDGFAELSVLDKNNDGHVNGAELDGLAIWNDRNSNTHIDKGEISTLAEHKIVSLALEHYKYISRATRSSGKSVLMEDVWLPLAPMASLGK